MLILLIAIVRAIKGYSLIEAKKLVMSQYSFKHTTLDFHGLILSWKGDNLEYIGFNFPKRSVYVLGNMNLNKRAVELLTMLNNTCNLVIERELNKGVM
jgi:hypothetical protein